MSELDEFIESLDKKLKKVFKISEKKPPTEVKNNNNQSSNKFYLGFICFVIIVLLATLPFHYVFYDGIKIFTKENFTFHQTFVTERDIDKLIEKHNNASFWDQSFMRSESLHKKLKEEGIIVNEKSMDEIFKAESIAEEYSENKDKSDRKYLNNTIKITGKVIDIFGGNIVELYGNSSLNVVCLITDKTSVSNFSKGDKVTIKGICSGMSEDGTSVDIVSGEVVKE